MSNLEIIDNKMQAIIETINGTENPIYVLSLNEKYGEPYIERLDINPLDTMNFLLNDDEIFFIRKVEI